MNGFIGRESELSHLERVYREERIKTCMIYGRRRIGKTALLAEFASDKPNLFVEFDDALPATNLEILDKVLSDHTGTEVKSPSMRHSMDVIYGICASEKGMVVIFDELPYLTSRFKPAASELQHLVDRLVRDTDAMVIVCGSSISLMIDEVFRTDKPLFGRFMFCIHLQPFSLEEVRGFHPSVPDRDLLNLYLVLGGITAYHSLVGDHGFRESMNRYILNRFGFIQSDILHTISTEVRGRGPEISSIFKSIVAGDNAYGAIRNRTGISETELTRCMDILMTTDMVRKVDCMLKPKKSKMYEIADPMTSFYYSVVDRNRTVLENCSGDVYEGFSQLVSSHLGKVFEQYCRDFVSKCYTCSMIGTWWGPAPIIKGGSPVVEDDGRILMEDADIDVVAIIRRGNDRINLFGECKYTNAPMGFGTFNTLKGRVESLKGSYNSRFALFSVSGFTDELVEYATENGVLLFDLDILVGRRPAPEII
ncbi:MAG: AAA family ATPase [Candidatus Methanomethylophilaceae archaeon]|nr:AAA family ATPase [Candidatus Methanomethylophilaceae archaeon]